MITSKQNEKIKQIRLLSNKKFRDSLNLFLVEGAKATLDALACNVEVDVIVGTEKGFGLLGGISNVKTMLVTEEVFSSITTEVSPQGIMAVCKKPSIMQDLSAKKALFLDGVSDPSNVGAIIRSAASFGFRNVYLSLSADAYSPKAVRASMGGIFRVNPIVVDKSSFLQNNKLPLIVADMYGEDVSSFEKLEEFCLVIGNEGNGVSEEVIKKSNKKISIPMQNGMESLNAAVSAGILMYLLK